MTFKLGYLWCIFVPKDENKAPKMFAILESVSIAKIAVLHQFAFPDVFEVLLLFHDTAEGVGVVHRASLAFEFLRQDIGWQVLGM